MILYEQVHRVPQVPETVPRSGRRRRYVELNASIAWGTRLMRMAAGTGPDRPQGSPEQSGSAALNDLMRVRMSGGVRKIVSTGGPYPIDAARTCSQCLRAYA